MAQFTVGGRMKSVFTVNGLPIGFDALHHHYKVKHFGGGGGVFVYSSSEDRKRKLCASAVNSPTSSPSSNYSDGVFDDFIDDDSDIEMDDLSGYRGLVLDIAYRPVNVVCWKRAICLEFMDKADVLEYYDQTISSPSGSFYIPAVLRVPHLLQVVKRRKVKRGLSRKNIYHRDHFMCQYCSSTENLTIDHVIPISRGGKWTWENLVAACVKCNSRKGQKTLEEANMKLLKAPKALKDYDVLAIPLTNHAIRMLKSRKGMPEEWQQYLSKPFLAP